MASGSIPELPVLLVDDEPTVLSSMTKVLKSVGIDNLHTCSDSREVLPFLEQQEVEAVLLDITMPHLTGDVLLKKIHELYPHIPIIIVTASDDIDMAVGCMKEGAFDYMIKAVEPNRLTSGIQRAIDMRRLARRYSSLRERLLAEKLSHPEYFQPIITRNPRVQAIFRFIESIAPTSETVLITGETGTGKELFAEAIHAASGSKGPLVKVNSAGLDDNVFSDTLFGHSKGAYTGADSDRKGLVHQANIGTLFLDEIGDLSAACQIKLLRLVESREYYPLGSDLPRSTKARFLIATNKILPELVASEQFRRDLYYRLQTYEIRIPPLRERKDDLPLLVDHFHSQAAEKLGKKKLSIPPELLTLLETYGFPGNVRELRSMVFNAVSRQKEKMLSLQPFREAIGYAGEEIRTRSAEEELTFPEKLPTLKGMTDRLIEEALSRAKGNQAIAAGLLGITPQALSKRLKRRKNAQANSDEQ
ncbi:MAG: sigma-54-dependent Fis family transcriptional regulator [Spirochaetaceae bacterium]|nr:MAG: sigma-54-dependent Fis family transcriptional regulator [Spirochaetaceae bacterium]